MTVTDVVGRTGRPDEHGPRPARPARPARAGRSGRRTRRDELAAFLRSRRERISPADVGLLPGPRRRTPGLRREEIAQLAGVGITWYTWLEQGRPINVSAQVLDAVARALLLDDVERAHLHRLARVPAAPPRSGGGHLPPEVQLILDGLSPIPAVVYSDRFDLLAWNDAFAAVFPLLVRAPVAERNALWQAFTVPRWRNCFVDRDAELSRLVATLRSAFGRHVGEPAWTEFVHRLISVSPEFARLWARHDVAAASPRVKILDHPLVGIVRTTITSMRPAGMPDASVVVFTPHDEESRAAIGHLLALHTGRAAR